MKKKTLLSLLLVIACLLTGCGASTKASAPNLARQEMAAPEEMAADSMAGSGQTSSDPLPEGRKWIVTVHISAETNDLDAAAQALDSRISELEGYVENQHLYNGSQYSRRSTSLTVRIPADRVDSFTNSLSGFANVVSKEKNLEDVTLRYVATESRMRALETEETRLLELLAQAETMSDLLEIEGRLTDVRYELENATSQMRLLSNQIDYATVYLDLEEVLEFTPVEEPGVWQRISHGFMSSLKGLGRGIVNVFVWIVACSPYLVVLGSVIAAVVLIVRHKRKKK